MSQSQETPEVPEGQVAGAQDPATGAGSAQARDSRTDEARGSADEGPANEARDGAETRGRASGDGQANASGDARENAAGEVPEDGLTPEDQAAPAGGEEPAADGGRQVADGADGSPGAEAARGARAADATEGAPDAAGTSGTDGSPSAEAPSSPESDAQEPAAQPPAGRQELSDPLSEAMSTISSLEDQLARRAADLYNLEQQYNSYVRRSKAEAQARKDEGAASVVEALLPVLDDAALAREHGDLTGPVGAIVEKFEQTLRTSFGVERYGAVGDEFDPLIHEALMHSHSADVDTEQVGTLIQPGYRIGEKVLRPARVGVVSPE